MVELARLNPKAVFALLLANIALSYWAFYLDPVINNDGVLYVSIANLILEGDWQNAFKFYNWPFYPALIAALSSVLFIEAELAAYLLNAILIILLTFGFTSVVGELSGYQRNIMLIALVVVVLFPSITKYRAYMIRDFGYLACYLWSLYFLLRFCREHKRSHLIGWILLALASCLFRFEGIAFLLVAPYFLVLFIGQDLQHRRKILVALATLLLGSSLAALSWYIHSKYATSIEVAEMAGLKIGSLTDLFYHNLSQRYGKDIMSLQGVFAVVVGNIGDVSYEVLRRLAVVYFVFAMIAIAIGLVLKEKLTRQIWLIYLVVNLLLLIGYSVFNSFLVSRYTMATALTVLLLAPFTIHHLLVNWHTAGIVKKTITALSFLILILVSIEGLDVRTNKLHQKEAGEWISENLPSDSRIYSNNRIVMYYSGTPAMTNLSDRYSNLRYNELLRSDRLERYDYIALDVNNDSRLENDFRTTLWFEFGSPVAIITGRDDNNVYIHGTKMCPASTTF
ncbi:MAG: hypothetical protein AAF197_03495 [Pseudomonadota bacterium]